MHNAPVNRTLTLEELGERPRTFEEPPPTRTAVPVASLVGGETPPPVESGQPVSTAQGGSRHGHGAGLALALGLAALVTLGALAVGAWAVLGSHGEASGDVAHSSAPAAVLPAAPVASAAPAPGAQSSAVPPASAQPSASAAAPASALCLCPTSQPVSGSQAGGDRDASRPARPGAPAEPRRKARGPPDRAAQGRRAMPGSGL